MKITRLQAQKDSVWITVPPEEGTDQVEEKIRVDFNPGNMTLEMYDSLKNLATDPTGADVEAIRAFLGPVLIWWDLEDDEGNNLSVDEYLTKVPLPFLGEVVQAISESSLPNPQTPVTSDGHSQQTVGQVTSLTGTPTSDLPTDSDIESETS